MRSAVAGLARFLKHAHSAGSISWEDPVRASLSARQRQRIQKTTVGLSLREIRSCQRFSAACRLIQPLREPACIDWSGIAVTVGYYDQPQFIRHCRRYTGLTPVQLHRSIRAFPLDAVGVHG